MRSASVRSMRHSTAGRRLIPVRSRRWLPVGSHLPRRRAYASTLYRASIPARMWSFTWQWKCAASATDGCDRQCDEPGEAFPTHAGQVENVSTTEERRAGVYDRTMAPALDHVQVMMPKGGEDEARAFYAGLLGLTEVEKPGPMRANGGVWFAEGIHVSGEEGFSAPRRAHPALRVDGVDALAATLTAAGCAVEWDERWPACGGSTRAIRLGTA